MSLIDAISKHVKKTRTVLGTNRDSFRDYLIEYELRDYFDNASPADKERLKSGLEGKLDFALNRYDKELGGWIGRKGISKTAMGLAIANDVYGYISNVPFANVSGLAYGLFAIKSIAEIPALYRYVKKSHDWYGALTHTLLKPVRYLLPVIGPALESGAFDRMIRRRVLNESKEEFIKEFGKYSSLSERINAVARVPIADILDISLRKAA